MNHETNNLFRPLSPIEGEEFKDRADEFYDEHIKTWLIPATVWHPIFRNQLKQRIVDDLGDFEEIET